MIGGELDRGDLSQLQQQPQFLQAVLAQDSESDDLAFHQRGGADVFGRIPAEVVEEQSGIAFVEKDREQG